MLTPEDAAETDANTASATHGAAHLRRHAALAAQAALAERLRQLTANLNAALDPELVASHIVNHGRAALGATAGSIVLLADDGEHLKLVRTYGIATSVAATWSRFPLTAPTML